MTNTAMAGKLAGLTLEQRQALFNKLRPGKATRVAAPQPVATKVRTGDGSNFRYRVRTPGMLESIEAVALGRVAPGPGQVEVELYAASLNFRDLMMALAIYPAGNVGDFSYGLDWSGRVTATGEGVEHLAVDDEVMGLSACDFSAYTTCNASSVSRKPTALSHVEAACVPTVFLTSYFGLYSLARLEAGERVLIHSAAGGVGLSAIEIAKWRGAEIYATAGNAEKRSYLRSLGIEHVFGSHDLGWADEVMAISGGLGVDVVLNSLTSEGLVAGLRVLGDSGRFVEIGMRDLLSDATIPLRPFSRGLSMFATGIVPEHKRVHRATMLGEIADLFDSGALEPIPQRTFALQDLPEAFAFMSRGVHMGKIAIDMRDQSIAVITG